MKYNTLRDYMGGGRNMPMSYQQGGSGARKILGMAGLDRGYRNLQDTLEDMQAKANKRTGNILKFGKLGTGLISLVAPRIIDAVLPGAGLLTTALAKGALSGIGRFAGEKLGGATTEKVKAGKDTGFGTDIKEDIVSASRTVDEGSLGRALGAGAGTALVSGVGDFAKAKVFGGGDTVMVRGADGKLTEQAIPQADVAGFDKAFEQSGALDMPGGEGAVRLGLSEAPGDSMEGMLGDVAVPELNLELDDFSNLPKAPSVSEKAFQESLGASNLMGQRAEDLVMAQDLSGIAKDLGGLTPSRPEPLEFLGESAIGAPLKDITFGGSSGVDMDDTGLVNLLSRTMQGPEESNVGYNRRDILTELLGYNQPPTLSAVDVFGGNLKEGGMMRNYAGGGKLKQVPQGNRGLAKLPEAVRNRMGYMMKGGMMDDYMGGGMMDMYMYGGMAKKKKKYGYMGGGMTMGRGLIDMMPFKRRIV
tara:strand:+ start:3423 stop:4844 length:1422 start_codon:yes stop_codon:yes gene_type:complete